MENIIIVLFIVLVLVASHIYTKEDDKSNQDYSDSESDDLRDSFFRILIASSRRIR
jgi:hypothetical protein